MNDENKPNNGDNNNFFNKNPILTFAIFAIVMILLFRSFAPEGMSGIVDTASSRSVSYSDFKQMIKSKEISSVAIGQTMVKAQGVSGAT